MRAGLKSIAALACCLACGSAAEAQTSYVPFYGYSTYFGGPAPYFTHDRDVRSASTISSGLPGYGTRTYYWGGPFYQYQSRELRRAYYPRKHRRQVVLRRRG